MPPVARRALALTVAFFAAVAVAPPRPQAPPTFAATIAQLSEPGGYFDTNNLISNERSYLHVIPTLREAGVAGGAYLGVGPDQNFSYIAHTRPSIAFIIDVRRDNLLLHLLFKALFRLSASRAEYLSALFGRPAPEPAGRWRDEDIERILSYVAGSAASAAAADAIRARADDTIKRFGVALSDGDRATIDRFHRTFIERGPALRFESTGRPPRSYYPTYQELLLESDRSGRRWNYLADEPEFQFVKSLQDRDLVVPVVGDLAGRTAMPAIARHLKEKGVRLSVFYTSNVEYYLANAGALGRFTANLALFPRSGKTLIIRSVFPNRFGGTPTAPGYYSASVVQRADDLLDGVSTGRIRGYQDLIGGR
jgi:hypothetical protein